MIPGHHCFGVLTLTSWLQKLALIASKKTGLSHLCLFVLLLCRLLPYARTSVHVITVQVEIKINLEKETKLFLAGMPGYIHSKFKTTMLLKKMWLRHWGILTNPSEDTLYHVTRAGKASTLMLFPLSAELLWLLGISVRNRKSRKVCFFPQFLFLGGRGVEKVFAFFENE